MRIVERVNLTRVNLQDVVLYSKKVDPRETVAQCLDLRDLNLQRANLRDAELTVRPRTGSNPMGTVIAPCDCNGEESDHA